MTRYASLYVNNVDTGFVEWGLQTEEVLGGIGRATVVVQDRTNSWEPAAHDDIKIKITSTGWVLFHGEIITPSMVLPVGQSWRRWDLDCADYNGHLDQRLVGAVDGTTWIDVDGYGDYICVDPYANSIGSDYATIQALFSRYFRFPDGTSADTTTFVSELMPAGSFETIYWESETLQSALEDMASQVAVNIQFWLDPDDKVHWVSIPEWQSLPQVAGSLATQTLGMMMPESNIAILGTTPLNIDMDTGDGVTTISGRELSFAFDGSTMPQQVYVRGETGFTYNNGVDPFAIADVSQQETYPGQYTLVVNSVTNRYSRTSSGYIADTQPPLTIAAGGPYYVNPIYVPINPEGMHRGGAFWELKTGPYPGWLISQHTNELGYGDITVEVVSQPGVPPGEPPPSTPTVGIGGTGWVGGLPDPTKRQAYVDASSTADSQATRDAVGNQALYRGSSPTLRGSVKVTGGTDSDGVYRGPDEWRVGQLIRISDVRLPTALNGRYFVIQRVQTNLIAEQDLREYTLGWGDGPAARYTQRKTTSRDVPPPAVSMDVEVLDYAPVASSSQVVVAQMVDAIGLPKQVPDKLVSWSMIVFDADGAEVTGEGTLDPPQSMTDRSGKARTTFTAGATKDLIYFIYASIVAL